MYNLDAKVSIISLVTKQFSLLHRRGCGFCLRHYRITESQIANINELRAAQTSAVRR